MPPAPPTDPDVKISFIRFLGSPPGTGRPAAVAHRERMTVAARVSKSLLTAPQSATGSLTQLVSSKSLLCFAVAKVMPGFAFPPAGRLGLTSPPSSVLRSAKTASVHPGWFAPRSLPVPTPVPLCFVSLTPEGQARPSRRSRTPCRRQGSCSAGTPALPAICV